MENKRLQLVNKLQHQYDLYETAVMKLPEKQIFSHAPKITLYQNILVAVRDSLKYFNDDMIDKLLAQDDLIISLMNETQHIGAEATSVAVLEALAKIQANIL